MEKDVCLCKYKLKMNTSFIACESALIMLFQNNKIIMGQQKEAVSEAMKNNNA
jgi:hypothetical protein